MKNFSMIVNNTNKAHFWVFALMVALLFGFSNPIEAAVQAMSEGKMDITRKPKGFICRKRAIRYGG